MYNSCSLITERNLDKVLQGSESKHVDSPDLFTNQVFIKKSMSAGLKMSEFCAIIWT